MPDSNSRYRGKPLLRLLECYVLRAIGRLPEQDGASLVQMTPKLRSLYRVEGDWQEIIAAVMKLPANMPELIRESWAKNSAIAEKAGTTLSPQLFAEMLVDRNLSGGS